MTEQALLVVDLQNDFCSGGALEVQQADQIVPRINKVMNKFKLVVASQDYHPPETIHFNQWPVHCVKGTAGAEFHPDFLRNQVALVVRTGTTSEDHGYSAFESTEVDLSNYLKSQGVKKLYVCGLATDYCVKESVLAALENGFETFVLTDCIKAVNVNPHDGEKAVEEMKGKGALLITSDDLN
ncbi:MAG: isochorismatase family protein [bacterium]